MKYFLHIFSLVIFLVSCGAKKVHETNSKVFSKDDYPYIEKFHEGIRYKMKGQIAQSISTFENCLTLKPDDDAVYYALSQLYLQTQQLAKSSEAIKKAVSLDPQNKWYLQEFAYMQFEAKNYKEAAKSFKALSNLEPNNIDWLFSYAESLMRSNDYQGAVKALDNLEKEIGPNPELSIEKFKLYRKIKQDDKAVLEIEKALKDFPDDVQLLANLVDYYFEKKEDAKAFDYLIKLSVSQPTNGNAHLALAQYYDRKGDKVKSYEQLSMAFKCDDVPIDTKVKILISMFETQFKLDPQMFELANSLIEKYPSDARVYTIRGDLFFKEGKQSEALIDFQEALKYDKTKFAIWEQVLVMEYQAQDYPKLYEDAKQCLEFFPAIAKVYLFFGVGANQLKKYNETIDKLLIGEELVANDNSLKAEILAQMGDAYFASSKNKEGKEAYDKALKLDTKNILLKNNYAYRLALAKIDLDNAESLIIQVVEQSPNESHFIDTYGWILFQKGDYKKSLEKFQQALSLKPDDKHILEHNGDAQFKLGNIQEALSLWKKAKEMGSQNLKLNEKIEKKTYLEPQY
jgi:tetratricopeptide (TPR) repeat protein